MLLVERAPLTACGLASAVRVEIWTLPAGVAVTVIAFELARPEYLCEWMFTRLPYDKSIFVRHWKGRRVRTGSVEKMGPSGSFLCVNELPFCYFVQNLFNIVPAA